MLLKKNHKREVIMKYIVVSIVLIAIIGVGLYTFLHDGGALNTKPSIQPNPIARDVGATARSILDGLIDGFNNK